MAEERGIPRIGDPAPDFSAVTTLHQDFSFSVWQEQHWVVLFSHPADFTPVCTTELVAFAQSNDQFRRRGIKLIGLSVDSIHAHLAWVRNIKETWGVTIPFPMVADGEMKVAQLYGMIHPNASSTATVRAVFVIDPKRTIRAIVYYPLNAGRNIDEILRLTVALQTTDRNACATPANWKEGDKVVVPPPKTVEEVEKHAAHQEWDHKDFYLSMRDLTAKKEEAGKPAAEQSSPAAEASKPTESQKSDSLPPSTPDSSSTP